MHRAYTAPHKSPEITGCEEAKMVVARVILMSAMLTVGIVEMTKTTPPRMAADTLAEETLADVARKAAPVAAPAEAVRVAPVSTAPASDRACTEVVWPYRPESCLRPESASQEAGPRRPVRVIQEQRPATPVRMPGRVSVG
ncbi:hypothetical protein [Methylobacterium frigidaeris]|nr:hypothetical protein [Methylobacterium frigidaeris]